MPLFIIDPGGAISERATLISIPFAGSAFLCMMVTGWMIWRSGMASAIWYCIAWSLFSFCNAVAIVVEMPNSDPVMGLGILAEHILLAFLLADIINRRKAELLEQRVDRKLVADDLLMAKESFEAKLYAQNEQIYLLQTKIADYYREIKQIETKLSRQRVRNCRAHANSVLMYGLFYEIEMVVDRIIILNRTIHCLSSMEINLSVCHIFRLSEDILHRLARLVARTHHLGESDVGRSFSVRGL